VEPTTVSEYILKGTILAALGQAALLGARAGVIGGGAGGGANGGSAAAAATALLGGLTPRDALKRATSFFHLVGASPSECDTIPGRQAMALCFFLKRQFDDVVVYLSSVKQYLYAEDEFNWNYGVALAAVGNYEEAEKSLLLVSSPTLTTDASYVAWLARCYCMNGRARAAWDLYLTRSESSTGAAALQLLRVIATDSYTVGAFLFSAKAFDVLEKLDPAASEGDAWAGKAGACAGVLQAVVAGVESKDSLREVHAMVRASAASALPGSHIHKQADALLRAMQGWAARQK
jgi:intraflagellar transport protein 56